MKKRVQYSNPKLEFLPRENIGRVRRRLSMEISSLISDETIDNFHRNQLMEAVRRIE
jgi:hypothetical protein